jgi:hypothetical protein
MNFDRANTIGKPTIHTLVEKNLMVKGYQGVELGDSVCLLLFSNNGSGGRI